MNKAMCGSGRPPSSRPERLMPSSFVGTVMLLGSLVFFSQFQQDFASRPSSDEDREQQGALSVVSLSARASGILEDDDGPAPKTKEAHARHKRRAREQERRTKQAAFAMPPVQPPLPSLAVDPTEHCADDATTKCQVAVQMFMQRLMDFSDNAQTFTVDFILTMEWIDKRVSRIIPKGLPYLTMDKAEATSRLWVPNLRVLNRLKKGDTTFWELKASPDGSCILVQRRMAKISQAFDFTTYPFDTKTLEVELGSPRTLAGELELSVKKGMAESSVAVASDFCHSTRFTCGAWSIKDKIVTNDLPSLSSPGMGWSRVVFTLDVDRVWWRVMDSEMVPIMFMLGVCWLVTWYPRLPGFTMPKSVSLMIALLTLLQCRDKTTNKLPVNRLGSCWLEGFEDACLFLACVMLVNNVFMEIVYHKWGMPELSGRMSGCAKKAFPSLCVLVVFTCYHFIGRSDMEAIQLMQNVNRVWIMLYFAIFIWYFHNESVTLDIKEQKANRKVEGQQKVHRLAKGGKDVDDDDVLDTDDEEEIAAAEASEKAAEAAKVAEEKSLSQQKVDAQKVAGAAEVADQAKVGEEKAVAAAKAAPEQMRGKMEVRRASVEGGAPALAAALASSAAESEPAKPGG